MTMSRRAAQVLCVLGLVLATESYAMRLQVIETPCVEFCTPKQVIKLDEAVIEDPKGTPTFNLFQNNDPDDRSLINLLVPGIPVDRKSVRDEIGRLMVDFPPRCEMRMTVAPIEDVGKGVKDKRRIYKIGIFSCAEETPRECASCLCDTGGFDFGLSSLKIFLRECKAALDRIHENPDGVDQLND